MVLARKPLTRSGGSGGWGCVGWPRGTRRLLDTFTSADYIGMVAFESETHTALGHTTLVQATDANRAAFGTHRGRH